MKYSDRFGKKSSRILLGTTYFGDGIEEEESFFLMDLYRDLGGNHLDVARMYANGRTEEIVGRYLRSRKPTDLVLSTKGGAPTPDRPLQGRLREEEIRGDLEKSLTALGRSDVDFYWLHRDDVSIPAGQIVEMMNDLAKEGFFPAFGASNWTAARMEEADRYAAAHGLRSFSAGQIRFSPAQINEAEERKTPDLVGMNPVEYAYYRKKNLPVAAFSSQAKGYFSKLSALGEEGLSQKAKDRYHNPKNLRILERILSLCDQYRCSVAAVISGAFSRMEAPECFPIIGSRTEEQLRDSLSGADLPLTEEEAVSVLSANLFV